MKITITGAAPDPEGLRLALRIENEKAGWVRFAATVLICDRLTVFERQSLVSALDHAAGTRVEDLDQPLF